MPIRAFIYSVISVWLLSMVAPLQASAITLAWNASSGATGYHMHYGQASGVYTTTLDVGPAVQVAISGLTPGQTYYFVATAYNMVGESGPSNEVSSVIPNSPPPPPPPPPSSDTTRPTVTITAPSNGSQVIRGSTVSLSAAAADNVGVVSVRFTVERRDVPGAVEVCTDTSNPYGCGWVVPNVRGRYYIFLAYARDAAGNEGVSAPVQVRSN